MKARAVDTKVVIGQVCAMKKKTTTTKKTSAMVECFEHYYIYT